MARKKTSKDVTEQVLNTASDILSAFANGETYTFQEQMTVDTLKSMQLQNAFQNWVMAFKQRVAIEMNNNHGLNHQGYVYTSFAAEENSGTVTITAHIKAIQ